MSKVSLPVRECGLKSGAGFGLAIVIMSLPVRECGLKLQYHYYSLNICRVPPRAGVWIEMSRARVIANKSLSLPVRECGLKLTPTA